MRVAPNRVSKPLLPYKSEAAHVFGGMAFPEFKLVRLNDGLETITLAIIEAPIDSEKFLDAFDNDDQDYLKNDENFVTIVAGSLLNPEDNLNRKIGRKHAIARLSQYLVYGAVHRHADGRSADHFVLEVSNEDRKSKTWVKDAAQLILDGTYVGRKEKTDPVAIVL